MNQFNNLSVNRFIILWSVYRKTDQAGVDRLNAVFGGKSVATAELESCFEVNYSPVPTD